MVHRPSDLRLLNSLLSNEKEYHKQLLVLLDTHSQLSLGAFSAYASASPAPVARALIAVGVSFAGADIALRRYAASVESWHAELRALKDLEEDVKNVLRDREILVTRLIKLSKNQKPRRDSFIGTLGPATGDASQISLNSFTPGMASSSKLGAAQAELQACESHLAAKEKELDQLRVSTVQHGLEARCKAMVECGWSWGEKGKEGLRALEGMETSFAHDNDVHHKPLPDPDRPPGSDLSSIGPSQSASQIYLPALSSATLTDQAASTLPRDTGPSPFPPRSSSPFPAMPLSSITLEIPPAHSISEFALPSTFERRISEEYGEADGNSSDEDSRPVEVFENVRFKSSAVGVSASTSNVGSVRRFSLRGPRPRDNSGSNTTSSGTGTGTGSFSQHASSALAPSQPSTQHSLPHVPAPLRDRKVSGGGFFSSIAGLFRSSGNVASSGTEKWRTRTEANLRAVRRSADSDSEDEGTAESPSRRLFGRRVSHDLPPPPSPTPAQKLKKRSRREKEREGGYISDGATVAGRDARKGSIKQRPPLSGASPSTSAPKRSASVASANPSFVSASGSSTPTRARPKAKPKTDLRVEALSRSSTTDVSRQGILRSSESVPPVPKHPGSGGRTSELSPSRSAPGSSVSRSSLLSHHGKSNSTSTAPPPSHADAGRAGASQMSLLTIVESVTRDNRAAWDRATSGLPLDSSGGAGPVGGLVSVRAPPSVTKYNLRGEGGHGISFESVLAPGSVFDVQPPPRSEPQRAKTLPPPPRAPIPTTPAASASKTPLRSALRNHSPPPVPPPKPIVIPSAPPRVVVEAVAPRMTNGTDNNNDDGDDGGSDSGSIASFQTVRETLDEDSPTPIPPPAPVPAAAALALPKKDDSDVSTSTLSAGSGAGAGAGVARRKSVRMSLQPTFSPTPPALDEDEDEAWGRSGRPWRVPVGNGVEHANGVGGGKERERDFWADSSDEDEEYSNARKMLMRVSKKKRW